MIFRDSLIETFFRDIFALLYSDGEEMTDGEVLDAVNSLLRERTVECGVDLDHIFRTLQSDGIKFYNSSDPIRG